ncbi:MAG: S1 RNA-binding domain-containing protein [Candidatus Margulisbacteria bacterium]|nr:S1 RNA-binding domain-containing protein [Candidatus Margulisiibacteriota bacterium]
MTSNNEDLTESNESQAIEPGNVISVEVTNIADFGAFVRCENGEEGLIHISEVANEFVTNINKYVKLGEKISVKVLGRNKKGKLEFSIKKVADAKPKKALFIRSSSENKEFEDVLTKFLKRSDEKQVDIRRNMKKKQGITKKKY